MDIVNCRPVYWKSSKQRTTCMTRDQYKNIEKQQEAWSFGDVEAADDLVPCSEIQKLSFEYEERYAPPRHVQTLGLPSDRWFAISIFHFIIVLYR